jgi:hypothetical protein
MQGLVLKTGDRGGDVMACVTGLEILPIIVETTIVQLSKE